MKSIKKLILATVLSVISTSFAWATDYVKVTSASDLVAGDVYVIAEISTPTKYLVTGYGQKLTNVTSGFTVSSNTITTTTATPLEFTLGTVTSGNNTYYTLKYSDTDYLGYPGSGANFETATSTSSSKEQWSITPSTNAYKILNVNTNTRYIGRNGTNIGPYSTSNSYPNCYLFKKQTSSGGDSPSIIASNVNIAYNAIEGSIAYSLQNATGNVSASVTTGDWLTLGAVTESSVPFTCSANTSVLPRTASVTLSFTGASNKVVTVTQAGRPNNISEITAASTSYNVVGTVVAKNSKGFVIGDGTGYVYTYLGSAPSQAVNDKVKIAGTTGSYGQVIQFTSGATITTESTSSYDGAPKASVITAVPDYSTGLHLSTYLQFEGILSKSSSNYLITLGESQIQISYPTTSQENDLDDLVGKTVRVKGYFTGINSSSIFTVMLESVEEVTSPTLSVAPSSAESFSYVAGSGPSDDQMFEVTGSNLTSSDITASVSSDYEITENTDYSSSVTIGSGDIISVRLKAGLAKGNHNGTLTLSSEGASDVILNLSGTVTGQKYEISQYTSSATAHGTISFTPASPVEEGAEVTLTAEPADGYVFTADSWVFYKESNQDYVVDNSITVTNSIITMPSYDLYVDASFAAKPKYAITCAYDDSEGLLEASPASAYEGQTVTLSYTAETGFSLTSIIISKTSDGTATDITPSASGDDFTFTMPGYAVTATATFESVLYDGSFAKVTSTSSLKDGEYYVLYSTKAMNSTVTNGRMGATAVSFDNDLIVNPNKSVVWKLVKNGSYWDLYSEKEEKYCYIDGTNASSFKMSATASYHFNVSTYASGGGFKFKTTHSSNRGITYVANNSDFGSYADSNDPTVYLYKRLTNDPVILLSEGSVVATQAEAEGVITVTCKNMGNDPELDVLFYESNGTTPATYSWLSAKIDGDKNVSYVVDANEGAARSAYFKVHGQDENSNDIYSDLITISQSAYVNDAASLDFEYDGNGTGAVTGLTCSGTSTYSSSPKIQLNDTGDYVILKFKGAPGKLSFDVKGNSFSGGTFTVQTSENGVDYTDLAVYSALGSNTSTKSFEDLGINVRYIKWVYTLKDKGNVALGNIKLKAYNPTASTLTLGAALNNGCYWSTFFNSSARYTLPEGAKAYTMDSSNHLYRLGDDGSVIPAGVAVVIIADSASVTLTKSNDDSTIEINGTSNILQGSNTPVDVSGLSGTPYVLGIKNGNVGFYKYKGSSIPATKAYYVVNE